MSETLCVLPWIHLSTRTSGSLRLCCAAKSVANPPRITDDNLQNLLNNSYMKKVRSQMIAGEQPKECQTCFQRERMGMKSRRQLKNQAWEGRLDKEVIEQMNDKSSKHDGNSVFNPISIDLRLGNLCNLKCRSCNSSSSSKIAAENKVLTEKGYTLTDHMKTGDSELSNVGRWYESGQFWESMLKVMPTVRELNFAGGEPTLIKPYWDYLKECVNRGYAQKIDLKMNTNVTRINDEMLEILACFKVAHVGLSIDGINEVGEYIRHGSNWKHIESNIKHYLNSSSKIDLFIDPTIMIYNTHHLPDFISWYLKVLSTSKKPLRIWFNCLNYPKHLSSLLLPSSVRSEIVDELRCLKEADIDYSDELREDFKQQMDQLMVFLSQPEDLRVENKVNFIKYTKMLDEHRGESLQKVCPQLDELAKIWEASCIQ